MTSSHSASLKEDQNYPTVAPCCCCPMTYREFYSFINISDIIGCIIGLIITLIFIILEISVSLLAIFLTIVWLIVAILALCVYKSSKNFRSGIHKFYSVLRGVICIIDILFMCVLLGYVCFGDIHDVLRPFRLLLIILVLLLLVMCIFNMYWSALFFEITFSDSKYSPNTSQLTTDQEHELEPQSEQDRPISENPNASPQIVN